VETLALQVRTEVVEDRKLEICNESH
jgi:hypothetical protein